MTTTDTRTGGCWLLATTSRPTSLASVRAVLEKLARPTS